MVPFGFGVGDFIAAARLIDKIIHGLRDAHGAVSQYQELERELFGFKRALHEIEHLQVSDAHKPALDALKCVALGSQHVLEEFLAKFEKYNQSLGIENTLSKAKSLGIENTLSKAKSLKRKIQWVLPDMEAEIHDLRVIIAAHVGGLSMRQITLGLSCTSTVAEDVKGIKEQMTEVLDTVLAMKSQQTAQEQVLKETRRTLTNLFKMMKNSGELQPQIDRLIDLANEIWTSTLQNPEALVESNSSQSSSDLTLTWLEECEKENMGSSKREIASRPLRRISPLRKRRSPQSGRE